jgi:hypothetical protein
MLARLGPWLVAMLVLWLLALSTVHGEADALTDGSSTLQGEFCRLN